MSENMRIVLDEKVGLTALVGAIAGYGYTTVSQSSQQILKYMALGSLWLLSVVMLITIVAMLIELVEIDDW